MLDLPISVWKWHKIHIPGNLTFCIAGFNFVRPVTLVGVLVEGESFRTVEHISSAVHTIHELPTVSAVTKPEVTILVGAVPWVPCWLPLLWNTWSYVLAIHFYQLFRVTATGLNSSDHELERISRMILPSSRVEPISLYGTYFKHSLPAFHSQSRCWCYVSLKCTWLHQGCTALSD